MVGLRKTISFQAHALISEPHQVGITILCVDGNREKTNGKVVKDVS